MLSTIAITIWYLRFAGGERERSRARFSAGSQLTVDPGVAAWLLQAYNGMHSFRLALVAAVWSQPPETATGNLVVLVVGQEGGLKEKQKERKGSRLFTAIDSMIDRSRWQWAMATAIGE